MTLVFLCDLMDGRRDRRAVRDWLLLSFPFAAYLLCKVAVLGGSLLTFRTQRGVLETEKERRDVQSDMLARGAATSGHGIVLSAMMGDDGFRSSLG